MDHQKTTSPTSADDRIGSNRLAGKIALVTGGSSGIGLATAKLFVAEGAFVFITGRRQEELDVASAALGPNAMAIQGDIARIPDIDRTIEMIRSRKGRLDILFANAGIGEFAPIGSISESHFDKTFGVNVKGTLFTVQKSLTLMPDGSSIVLNASITGVKGLPAFSVYAASKAALRALARGWIVDLKKRRIRVNVVSPGTVPTPGYDGLGLTPQEMPNFIKAAADATPLGRVGTPEEIANAVLFLASSESSYVNGVELFVDGGFAQI
ncbi:SDR family oxidoreductase [Bradyrhizobium guangzhouense]|uniref:SDR family oxidoreductase n=1 Tax=Bradyrhizobium guangzhouense TaxID=1325095 RepID=UPI001009C5C8|nr:SDR family oxidoreductase [Bradyrhizobium guangzhouense]RXH09357.1 SDR family oxidoreductase [Bradyrhizobium guangzhouense]